MDGVNLEDPLNKKMLTTPRDLSKLENTLKLSDLKASSYRAIFFAGGHGTMWDFRENADVQRLTREIYEQGGVVSAV